MQDRIADKGKDFGCSSDRLVPARGFPLFSPIMIQVTIGFTENGNQPRTLDRYVSTIAIAAAIIAAVRLAKLADLDLSVANIINAVQQSVRLARTILDEAMRR